MQLINEEAVMPESRKSGKVIHLNETDVEGRGTSMRRPGARQADILRFLTPGKQKRPWRRVGTV